MSTLTDGEQKIYDAVLKGFPAATKVKVEDISGKRLNILKNF